MKTSLIMIAVALALLACLVVIGVRAGDPVAAGTRRPPSFDVRVVVPRLGLPLFGILPDSLATRLDCTPRELGFDQASRGAEVGRVGQDRLELRADGWDLSIEADGKGRITPGTRLVLAMGLGGNQVTLRCRPADPAVGDFHLAGSDELGGGFRVELASCEDVATGKAIRWPPAPLTVVGSFDGLPHERAD